MIFTTILHADMREQFSIIMMSICLLASVLFTPAKTIAQANGKSGKIPPFRIMQANGRLFKAEDLPVGKPIIIIYFSPECDHCDHLMKELFKRETDFRKASIAMITYLSVEKVAKFVKEYRLDKYPNIYVGTEGTSFFVRNYYNITDMPFAALYTLNGDFVKAYKKNVVLTDLSGRLHQLR